MLEYFTSKKAKKHKAEKERKAEADAKTPTSDPGVDATARPNVLEHVDRHSVDERPVLHPDDEAFIQGLLADSDGPAPPLPPRVHQEHDWHADWQSDDEGASTSQTKKDQVATTESKAADKAEKKQNRLSAFFTSFKKPNDGLHPAADVPHAEAEKEKHDLSRVLDRLNLSAKNNKVVSLTSESSELLQKFNQVFKDLVNGVPTAYDDLAHLVEDRDGTIAKGFDKLPSSLQKLVTQLPEKITGSLGPEILAAAAASQGVKTDGVQGGAKGMAKKIFMPQNVMELVTKPGAIVGMLRAIVEALKTRWPAFIGMNVLWSVALTLLLFVLWYCYKRGREVRLEGEKAASGSDVEIADEDRIEELPDDLALPPPRPETTRLAADLTEADLANASSLPLPPTDAETFAAAPSNRH